MTFVFFVSAGYPLVPKIISELLLVNEEMHEDCYENYVTNTVIQKVLSPVMCPY